jgi:DNA-binding transcriptional ArsR family regulator
VDSPVDRRVRYELANLGEAIGDPGRAAILIALMGGTERPASELARVAGVMPSTGTAHLARLVAAGLLVVRAQGRHRYYRLSGPRVARIIETLGAEGTPALSVPPRPSAIEDPLRLARTCYGHLAGRLAIAIWAQARSERWVRWSDAGVTLLPAGRARLAEHGLLKDAPAVLPGRPCLDWSERLPHVAGPLGIALCEGIVATGWVARVSDGRALRVTTRGAERLRALGVAWQDAPAPRATSSR